MNKTIRRNHSGLPYQRPSAGKSNAALYSGPSFNRASNLLPFLLLKPLITPVLPLVIKVWICFSVSFLPAISFHTTKLHPWR